MKVLALRPESGPLWAGVSPVTVCDAAEGFVVSREKFCDTDNQGDSLLLSQQVTPSFVWDPLLLRASFSARRRKPRRYNDGPLAHRFLAFQVA